VTDTLITNQQFNQLTIERNNMIEACKKCRREGEKLLLKGERCLSPKCAMVKRPYAPGQHGQARFTKQSEYGKQLREKQKARRIYGMGETQFANYAVEAGKAEGNTADILMKLLETRLDNVVYRLGFAASRSGARQMVSHGLMQVNGKKVSIPSYRLKAGDVIEPKNKAAFADFKNANVPTWIEIDAKKVAGTVKHIPSREEIDTTVNESLIIEFYSR